MNRFSPPPTSADPAFHRSPYRPPLLVSSSTMSNTPDGFEYSAFGGQHGQAQHQRYVLGSSVLLTAVLCLIFVIVLITALHLYARYKLRRQQEQRRRARAHVHRSAHAAIAAGTVERPKTGLDPAVVAALPKFEYKKKADQDQPEGAAAEDCSVCLSQMEEGEMVRRLPACGHSFHDNCIDMWLYSHITCPLCRMVVGPIANDSHIAATPAPATVEVVVVAPVRGSGGGDDISPRPPVPPQATSTQLLMPTLAGCSSGHGDSSHEEISEAPSRLAPFRRMFSLERAGVRRPQRADEGSPRDLERHQLAGTIV